MKNKIINMIFIIMVVFIVTKYFISDYKTNYTLDEYNITISYKSKRYYIEIKDDNLYNFDIYSSRSLKRMNITNITKIERDNFICLYPEIKNVETFPLCYLNNEYTSFTLISDSLLDNYKKKFDYKYNLQFTYNNNLTKDEYIYLWNYNGFYKMNYDKYQIIKLFNTDTYDNSLVYMMNDKIILPNYEDEYEFTSFYVLDIVTNKTKIITGKYDISYDSYIVGNINKLMYLYDIKYESLYEINIKTREISLICNEELGYFKYVNGEKIDTKKSDYNNKKIYYKNEYESNYKYVIEDDVLYKLYNDNKKIREKIFIGENIKIVDSYENNLYFTSDDILYKYNDSNIIEIFNYFELKFNTNNLIYIYQN